MRCIVPRCKNDSRHISKSDGITFHVFPTEPSIRTAWLKALGKEKWKPKDRSAICSEHFMCDDLFWTTNGLRKVRPGAIPLILPEVEANNIPSTGLKDITDCDYENTDSLKVCRICLAMDIRLLSIRKYKLAQPYQDLTGVSISEEDKMPDNLCVECAHRLISCCRFRTKSLKADSIMLEIIKKQVNLTLRSIKAINREENQLITDLTIKFNEPDHADLYIEFNEDKIIEEPIEEDPQIQPKENIALKNESNNEIFIEETENFIQDIKIEENNDIENHNDVENHNHVENNFEDKTDDLDHEFVASEPGFSSDDSLPLERQKTLKKVKRNRLDKSKKVKRKVKKDTCQPKIDRRRRPFLNADLNETLFTITELSLEEQLADIQKRQETANYKNSVFKCTACFKGFLDEEAYNSHMMRHTDQCGEHKCEVCKTHFKHSHALRKHITAHHTQRFSCNQCPYVTTHRQTARLHERWHKGTKYKCPHCPDEFVKFTTYMGHIRIKHPSDFVCELCGYSFVSEKGIDLHKKLKHRLDNDVQIPADAPYCQVCDVKFISSEALKKHMSVSAKHVNDNDRKPKEANKSKMKKIRKPREPKDDSGRYEREKESDLSERRIYPSQMRKAEGPIPCEQCGLQLEDSRAYHGHFRRMHPDKNRTNYPSMKSPCMCEICGRMFQSYALLRDHTWLHTGERPFKCDTCGKAFRMKQRLVAHGRVHRLEKTSYVCSVCGKHFSTHSNRQRHMFIHTGLKPFKCEMCGKGFKHASEKRAHIEYVHLKKPWPKRSRGKRRQDRPSLPHSAIGIEMEPTQPMWADAAAKTADINLMNVMEDKIYYNLKI